MKLKLYLSIILSGLFSLLCEKGIGQAPNWIWANGIGGLVHDEGRSTCLDNSGNSYTTGYFNDTVDFDPGPGTFNLIATGFSSSAFITKADSAGNFIWAKALISSNYIFGTSISIDDAHNIYITGSFKGMADMDPNLSVDFFMNPFGAEDVFITKLDSLGNFVWAKQLGGISSVADGYFITTDISGNVYTLGGFSGTCDFDPDSVSAFNLSSTGPYDVFISKLNNEGNFVWAKAIHGPVNVFCLSMETDAANNIYLAGFFRGTVDFDPDTLVSFNITTSTNFYDGYILKLDSLGTFVWAKSIGGASLDQIYSIALDDSANINITGFFQDTSDFDPGTGIFNLISAGNNDIFFAKLDSSGNFRSVKSMGGTGFDIGIIIKTDQFGSIYIQGLFTGTVDFDPGVASFTLTSKGNYENTFIAKYDNSDNLLWVKPFILAISSGNGDMELDKSNNVFLTGSYGPDTVLFDNKILINANAQDTLSNYSDIFIAKLSICFTSSIINPVTCGNYTSPSGKHIWNISGIYNDTIPNAAGCDSLITVNLIINSSSSTQIMASCNNYISPSGNYNWTSSGTYLDTIPNAAGCDSIITINLSINNSTSLQNITACNSYTSPSGIYNWTSPGTYTDTIINALGCDSVITINLTFNNSSSFQNISACNNYTSPSGNYIWTIPGTYMDTISNVSGCDSVITINLIINPLPVALYTLYPDTSLPHNWFALNQCTGTSPLTYLWNWGDSSAVSTGATPSHIYADSGYYNICVTVTDGNGCVSTYCDSSTYIYKGNSNSPVTVNVVLSLPNGIHEINGNSCLVIYPVPVDDVLTISLNKPLIANCIVTISDLQGRLIIKEKINHNNNGTISINVSEISPGVYLLRMDELVKRFVKK